MVEQALFEHGSGPAPGLCWEIGTLQQNKHTEGVCGDRITVSREDGRVLLVLSDGLGSGIQANIAATLTATLISGLTERGLPLEDSIRSVDAVLPVTKRQGLAYATFNLVCTEGQRVRLIQYDSPPAVFLRDGVSLNYPSESRTVLDKTLQESVLTMKSGDMLVLFSDGVSEAGRGVTTYSGWDRRKMEDYLFRSVRPDDDALYVAANIVSAVQALDLYDFHDDTSVAVLRLREKLSTALLIGPDDVWQPDDAVLSSFFSAEGLHVICGSGAAHAAARFLGKELRTLPRAGGGELPPPFGIEGVDLAVERGRTFEELLYAIRRYRQDGMMSLGLRQASDGASLLLKALAVQASDVDILCSAASDPIQESALPSGTGSAEQILVLRQLLTELGKTVTLRFF